MEVFGKEIKFLRTVAGNCRIARACPGGDINRFDELLDDTYAVSQTAAAEFIAALNESYEMRKHFDEPEYQPDPISAEKLLYLDDDTFSTLFLEALAAFRGDAKTTVEAEPAKKAEAQE